MRAAYDWVKRAANILANANALDGKSVQRRYRALLGAMARSHNRSAPTLRTMLAHFRKVTHSYWPGLFHCYHRAELPRTNNDLEQFFGAHRYHERRATGRKVASPALVLMGSVRLVAAAATRVQPFAAHDLTPEDVRSWQTLRRALATRRQHRTLRLRFRRNPAAYLARLEADFLQLSLPP